MGYLYLALAVIAEVIATSALKASNGLTNLVPTLLVGTGYLVSFYFLSLVLNLIPIGIAYAIWAGLGIVLVTLVAIVAFGQVPDLAAIIGMALIVLGVAVIHLFSKTTVH